jgi:hypothetical protein
MSSIGRITRNQFGPIISPTGHSLKSSDKGVGGRGIYQINEEQEEYDNYNSLD